MNFSEFSCSSRGELGDFPSKHALFDFKNPSMGAPQTAELEVRAPASANKRAKLENVLIYGAEPGLLGEPTVRHLPKNKQLSLKVLQRMKAFSPQTHSAERISPCLPPSIGVQTPQTEATGGAAVRKRRLPWSTCLAAVCRKVSQRRERSHRAPRSAITFHKEIFAGFRNPGEPLKKKKKKKRNP